MSVTLRLVLGVWVSALLGFACTSRTPEHRVQLPAQSATGVVATPDRSVALSPRAISPRASASVAGASVGSGTAAAMPRKPTSMLPEPVGAPPLRRSTHVFRERGTTGRQRIDVAERSKIPIVKALFESAEVKWPPRQLLLRAFKRDRRLEVWAADSDNGPLTHVTTYEVCYASGELGPKRQEGDFQVPEGFYRIVWFKPKSDFHMAMMVSYPNRSDRILGHAMTPGGEIMVHGGCVSVGCLAMSDERIEELWVIARVAPGPIDIHMFPARDMAGLVATTPPSPHREFWLDLKRGLDRFQRERKRFAVRVKRNGRYEITD